MKKILMMCVVSVLALSACDRHKHETRETVSENADTSLPIPAVTSDSNPGPTVVNTAMVNTPVPQNTPALQNTPAPTMTPASAVPGASTCGADQSWVGQNLKSIDLSKIKGVIRTLYPDQPATMDYSDQRLDILLERGTDKVLKVSCG